MKQKTHKIHTDKCK